MYFSEVEHLLLYYSEVEQLEKAAAEVFTRLLDANMKFLPSLQIISLKILLKLGPMLKTFGMAQLLTQEMRWAVCRLVCDVQDVLPMTYLQRIKSDTQRNELMTALIGEIGLHENLQVRVTAPSKPSSS